MNLLDDHEIEDNCQAKVDRIKLLTNVPVALHVFDVFQMSYSRLKCLQFGGYPEIGITSTIPRTGLFRVEPVGWQEFSLFQQVARCRQVDHSE